ncbi:MAG: membrane or secreted protein [Bacteroidetes bacterium]|nr:membrane or secreted protein [Bacteroidota bacterium]
MVTLILSIILVSFFFVGLGIKILLQKNGEFKGTCASQSPYLKNQIGACSVCGKLPEESECRNEKTETTTLSQA